MKHTDDKRLTHRAACNLVANWAMGLDWCDIAVVELSGVSTGEAPPFPGLGAPREKRKAHELLLKEWHASPASGGGQLDVLALTSPKLEERRQVAVDRWERVRAARLARGLRYGQAKPKTTWPRIAAVEVKVTRGDLLSDLRAGKLLRYEPQANRCYLAVTREAATTSKTANATGHEIVEALRDRGLRSWWGVVLLEPWARGCTIRCVQRAGPYPHGVDATAERRWSWIYRAARSMAHRQSRN